MLQVDLAGLSTAEHDMIVQWGCGMSISYRLDAYVLLLIIVNRIVKAPIVPMISNER